MGNYGGQFGHRINEKTMAGGTHVFDMIKRLRDNENLRKKNYFKVKNIYHRTAKSSDIDFRTATKEEREELRTKVVEEQKEETRRAIKLLLVSILLTAIMIVLIIRFVLP